MPCWRSSITPPRTSTIVASGFGRKAQWFRNIQAPVLEETLGAPITDTDSALPIVELRLD